MLAYFFSSLITQIIDSLDWVNFGRAGDKAPDNLAIFRESTVADLDKYDEMMPDDSSFLDDPKDRRLHNAKRSVYLAIIELIDAKADSLTD